MLYLKKNLLLKNLSQIQADVLLKTSWQNIESMIEVQLGNRD